MTELTTKDKLLALKGLRETRETARIAFEEADKEFKSLQYDVFEHLSDQGIESMKVDGTNFVRASTAYGSVQDREAFVEWAKQNDEALIEYKERGALINELVRERLDNGEELPPGLGMYTRDLVQQRKG